LGNFPVDRFIFGDQDSLSSMMLLDGVLDFTFT